MKYVYSFLEGNKDMREILGGKGANLAEMTRLNLPVPKGFVVSTKACNNYYENNQEISEDIIKEIEFQLKELERLTGKGFGDPSNPLMLSIRSGARASMPGMMDTILNLGLNDQVAIGFIKKTGNPRFVFDSYRRFIQMFGEVAMGLDASIFSKLLDDLKREKNVTEDQDLTAEDLQKLVFIYKDAYRKHLGEEFPVNPYEQLIKAVGAVFRSWNNERAITYRKINHIPASWGTAVNVQEMVYGNYGDTSASGVAFTRNPATGEKKIFGEYLLNAQGEDVVAGIRTPQMVDSLKDIMPKAYEDFVNTCHLLENHYKDMQDIEFTIENGKFYILQTRNGKRTADAALKIAVDLVNEGLISKEEALLKVDALTLDTLLHPVFTEEALKNGELITEGLAASPGAAFGAICFSADELKEEKAKGNKDLILVRNETSPEDIEGMILANGILTIHGGMTSHAAVVARGMGSPCVSGAVDLIIDEEKETLSTKDGKVYHKGDFISLDGGKGTVYEGKLETEEKEITGAFATFMDWADSYRRLGIKTNADNKNDAINSLKFGAEGVGLCRTEHMFFSEERILNFRKVILASNLEDRERALKEILPYQQNDFKEIFSVMNNRDVVIRLLDPPLHEFLPKTEEDMKELALALGVSEDKIKEKSRTLKEFNPMMGHRGCRLSISYPEICVMQIRAVIGALIDVHNRGVKVDVKIMVPLVGDENELKYMKNIITKEADTMLHKAGLDLKYEVGTMIEVPRACITANEIAEDADFMSFGTNDLTQMAFGFSRDDSASFLEDYYSKNIYEYDPFVNFDAKGCGKLVDVAVRLAKHARPNIELGICGEHGGDPKSIEFFDKVGLDYVSCSPYRVPIARLAAAQAAIKNRKIS